jgi:uncharacterized protein (TIGR04255 family)
MAKKRVPRPARLPNAPLAEVVFELRWRLVGDASLLLPLHTDPGLIPALSVFTVEAAKLGFSTTRDMSRPQETGAYGIARRFYKSADQAFPLLQLGPGIYASNQSSEYDFDSFKRQTLDGIGALLKSYPSLPGYPLTPTHLELRYIDVFDKSLVGTTDLFKFLEIGSTLGIRLPSILERSTFGTEVSGRLLCQVPVRGHSNTIFSFDVGSGKKDKNDVVRLETKIASTSDGPKITAPGDFLKRISEWLDTAHDVTSPFFRDFVTPELMGKFTTKV